MSKLTAENSLKTDKKIQREITLRKNYLFYTLKKSNRKKCFGKRRAISNEKKIQNFYKINITNNCTVTFVALKEKGILGLIIF